METTDKKTVAVTPEQIAQWKEKHGGIYIIEVAEEETELDPYKVEADLDGQKKAVGYLMPPDNKVMNFALQKLPMFLEAGKVIMKNCWLGGDDRLINDNGFLNGAAMQAATLISIRNGRIKKN